MQFTTVVSRSALQVSNMAAPRVRRVTVENSIQWRSIQLLPVETRVAVSRWRFYSFVFLSLCCRLKEGLRRNVNNVKGRIWSGSLSSVGGDGENMNRIEGRLWLANTLQDIWKIPLWKFEFARWIRSYNLACLIVETYCTIRNVC